tara:strand:+ start:28 stop:156 length:129 start_codon:yes stop_codon:yes gene_type:complete
MKPKKHEQSPMERLHDDYRRKTKESEEDEWIRLQRTGGGAET